MVSPQIATSVGTSAPVTRSNRRTPLITRSAGAVPRPWAMRAESDRGLIADSRDSSRIGRLAGRWPSNRSVVLRDHSDHWLPVAHNYKFFALSDLIEQGVELSFSFSFSFRNIDQNHRGSPKLPQGLRASRNRQAA